MVERHIQIPLIACTSRGFSSRYCAAILINGPVEASFQIALGLFQMNQLATKRVPRVSHVPARIRTVEKIKLERSARSKRNFAVLHTLAFTGK
jgi:hypothetical protein